MFDPHGLMLYVNVDKAIGMPSFFPLLPFLSKLIDYALYSGRA